MYIGLILSSAGPDTGYFNKYFLIITGWYDLQADSAVANLAEITKNWNPIWGEHSCSSRGERSRSCAGEREVAINCSFIRLWNAEPRPAVRLIELLIAGTIHNHNASCYPVIRRDRGVGSRGGNGNVCLNQLEKLECAKVSWLVFDGLASIWMGLI